MTTKKKKHKKNDNKWGTRTRTTATTKKNKEGKKRKKMKKLILSFEPQGRRFINFLYYYYYYYYIGFKRSVNTRHDSLSKSILSAPWRVGHVWMYNLTKSGRPFAYVTTTHDGLPQKRLEEDLCWIVPHVPRRLSRSRDWTELNWTELNRTTALGHITKQNK